MGCSFLMERKFHRELKNFFDNNLSRLFLRYIFRSNRRSIGWGSGRASAKPSESL